jgi:hypothetical protein
MKQLTSWFNPEALVRKMILDSADVAFFMVGKSEEPDQFDDAYNHPTSDARANW